MIDNHADEMTNKRNNNLRFLKDNFWWLGHSIFENRIFIIFDKASSWNSSALPILFLKILKISNRSIIAFSNPFFTMSYNLFGKPIFQRFQGSPYETTPLCTRWHLIAKQTDTKHIRHTMANLTHCGESLYHKYLNQVMKNFNFRLIFGWWKRYVVDFLMVKLFKC